MLKYRWLLDESRNLAQTIVELKYVQCSDACHLLKKYEKSIRLNIHTWYFHMKEKWCNMAQRNENIFFSEWFPIIHRIISGED